MNIEPFFDTRTWTLTYLVWDPKSRDAVIVDPVLDFDPLAVRVYEESVAKLVARVHAEGLAVHACLETHAHADHISGAARLREQLGASITIGRAITRVQATFAAMFDRTDFVPDGRAFDRLVDDGDTFHAGTLAIEVIATPGHTPACVTWKIGDALFTGDALFMPDSGTGRCDFPDGSATDLYRSIQKLYRLPDATRVFVGHDYQPGGRAVACETTIGAEKRHNTQLTATTTEEEYVRFRTTRDRTLRPPNLLFPALQCNIDAGRLPPPHANGRRYLCLPVGIFG